MIDNTSAMEIPKPSNPLSTLTSFVHQQWHRFKTELTTRFEDTKQKLTNTPTTTNWPFKHNLNPLFASLTQHYHEPEPAKHAFDIALSSDYVAKTLAGTVVYTVSNSSNEFVLIFDPGNVKALGLLCFRQEDAETLLAQVQLKQPVLGRGARVVPITLDQVSTESLQTTDCAEEADARGVLGGLQLAGKLGIKEIVVLSDCQNLISFFERRRTTHHLESDIHRP